jgi:radical SAM superfamily enzyme YgiQ (UPF0313 family)
MKILLINPPKEEEITFAVLTDYNTKARNNNPPLGLMYLYSYLLPYHEVYVVDMSAEELKIGDINSIIDNYKPDIIGISCVISKWPTIIKLSAEIKKYNNNIKIVVGGVNPSIYTFETLQCKDIDYVIRGFGQVPLLALCNKLEQDIDIKIENVFTRENYTENIKGTFVFEDLDKYPLPDRSILPVNNYNMPFAKENPTTSLLGSLGCPFSCHFCQCQTFKPLSIRKPETIINELIEIEKLGIRSVIFQDELFTLSDKRINEVCSLMIKNKIKLNWAVRARANPINEESLAIMKEAGCFNFHLGIESGNDRILLKMKKRITKDEVRESVRRIKNQGMTVSASFMLGYPTETKEEILETIDFAAELNLNICQFYITINSPGTELYKEWQERVGNTKEIFSDFTLNPHEIDLDANIASDIFTREELNDFVKLGFSKTNNLYNMKE